MIDIKSTELVFCYFSKVLKKTDVKWYKVDCTIMKVIQLVRQLMINYWNYWEVTLFQQ